jgi:chromosome segregation ATPase|tara:strand:- start:5142 stop:5414 length:273 start_codon:yes stop_codon:yes gene_type:complete
MTKADIVKRLGLINKLKKELQNRGSADLEVKIATLEKEVDTLKAVIDLKDIEINTLTDNLNKIKEDHNKKIIDKWEDDIANNTPNDGQFE